MVASADDAATAREMFAQGLNYMQTGLYDLGCRAIEQSYELDAKPGTLFTLAECEAKRGRIFTALGRYEEYLAFYPLLPADQKEKQGTREKTAREQKAALSARVPQVTLRLPKSAPPTTIVRRNGVVLEAATLGVATKLDPGDYTVTTRAPGQALIVRRFTLRPGDKVEIDLETGEPPKSPAKGVPPAPPPKTPPPKTPPPKTPPPKALPPSEQPPDPVAKGPSAQRVGTFIAGGAGVVGLVVGGVMGALTLSKRGVIDAHCGRRGDPRGCDDEGIAAARAAKPLGLASSLGFGVGIAGVGAAAVLLLTAQGPQPAPPRQAEAARWVSVGILTPEKGGATFGLRGGW
jgi:hypothetical protein